MSRLERLRAGLAHAFAVDSGEVFTERERELAERLARFVVRRRLTVPAVMVLESARPLSFLGSQVLAFFGPVATMALPEQDYDDCVRLLERRRSVDLMIDAITAREDERHG